MSTWTQVELIQFLWSKVQVIVTPAHVCLLILSVISQEILERISFCCHKHPLVLMSELIRIDVWKEMQVNYNISRWQKHSTTRN